MLTLRKNALVFCLLPLAFKNTSLNPNLYEVGGGQFSSDQIPMYLSILEGFNQTIKDRPLSFLSYLLRDHSYATQAGFGTSDSTTM